MRNENVFIWLDCSVMRNVEHTEDEAESKHSGFAHILAVKGCASYNNFISKNNSNIYLCLLLVIVLHWAFHFHPSQRLSLSYAKCHV